MKPRTAQTVDVGLFGSMRRYGDLGVHAVVDLRRAFSREELTRAVAATVADFPVLGCLYEAGFFRDRWVPAKGPLSEIVHAGEPGDLEAATARWTRRPLDPTRERPLRVVLLPRERGCRLVVSLAHLAVDGAGMAAVGHVLGAHLYGRTPMLPVEARRDLGRTLDGLSWLHLPVLARDTANNLLQPLRVFFAGRRERAFPAGGSDEPRTRDVVLEASEIEAIRARCGRRASVNDLLVAALARVGARRSKRGPVAVMYTMDLRRFSRSPHLSAANASSILTALVPRAATRDLPTAARVVGEITARHRRGLSGPAFVLLPVALSRRTPHGILRRIIPLLHPVLVDLPLTRGLMFTNVGKLDQGLGPFVEDMESIRIVGPNMRGVTVPIIVAFGLRGRLHLEMFAPPELAAEALEELESEIREALEMAG